MDYSEARNEFIETWGKLGSTWGVSRSMAQIHALLLISPELMSTEDIMNELKVSRGSANMNLRALLDWNLIHKELKTGDRKEYFRAEKDIWTVFTNVIIQRKKRELEPMIQVLQKLGSIEGDGKQVDEFVHVVDEIRLFSERADKTLSSVTESKASQFFRLFLRK